MSVISNDMAFLRDSSTTNRSPTTSSQIEDPRKYFPSNIATYRFLHEPINRHS
jgi:hypothetical protein